MQNVNLYQFQRERRAGPHPRLLLVGFAALVLILLLHGLWHVWRGNQAGAAAAAAELRAVQAEAELAEAQGSFVEPVLDPALVPQLAERERFNLQLQQLVDYLDGEARSRQGGFLPILSALGDRHPPQGLWLSRIRLREGTSELRLDGLTEDQELIPAYLESLGRSDAFRQRQFARLDVQREDNGLLRFELSSSPKGTPGDE